MTNVALKNCQNRLERTGADCHVRKKRVKEMNNKIYLSQIENWCLHI